MAVCFAQTCKSQVCGDALTGFTSSPRPLKALCQCCSKFHEKVGLRLIKCKKKPKTKINDDDYRVNYFATAADLFGLSVTAYKSADKAFNML